MHDTRLFKLARRLRPELDRMTGQEQFFAYLAVLLALFLLPYAVVATGWLIGVTDMGVMRDHPGILAALLGVLVVMHHHNFTIWIELDPDNPLPITGTLSGMIVLAGVWLFGPTVLWLLLVDRLIHTAQTSRDQLRRGLKPFWGGFMILVQDFGSGFLSALAGFAVYRLLGGAVPLTGLGVADWLPAVLGTGALIVVQQIVMQPVMVLIERLSVPERKPWFSMSGLVLIPLTVADIPFSILGALIYTQRTEGLFLAYVVGIALVNYMAYHLSKTNARSRQRAREMAQLEALGEALLKAPPDLSILEDLLHQHTLSMFLQDRFEIRLFPLPDADLPVGLVWPELRLIDNPERPPIVEEDWARLTGANQTHMVLAHYTPPGTRAIYGDALLVPIAGDDPGEEGGQKEQLLGGIALLRHRNNGKTLMSLAALQSLASQIGSAYYRTVVHHKTLVAQKMAQELALAGEIQQKFLPTAVPPISGWDLAAVLQPARQTSGDFYDFVPFEDGRVGVVVADVADKGTGAALYMALSRTLIRTFAFQHPGAPELALQLANDRLLTDAESDQFVTVFYGILDPSSGTLTYANAGHNPGFVLRQNGNGSGQAPIGLGKTGAPLGMFEGLVWKRETVTLDAGDVLLLYSDGVSEAQDAANAEFGEDRLCAAARAASGAAATAIRTAVTDAVRTFVGDAAQFDDITLVVAVKQ